MNDKTLELIQDCLKQQQQQKHHECAASARTEHENEWLRERLVQ